MKKLLIIPLITLLCSCGTISQGPQELDVCSIGRFDLNCDGVPEQIVLTGIGSGGPVWYIATLSGAKLSGELQGRLWIRPDKGNYPDLIVRQKCGWQQYNTSFLQYNGKEYKIIKETTEKIKE